MKLLLNPVAPDRARIETLVLAPNGRMPNNALPVVLIRGAFDGSVEDEQVYALYRSNGWQGCWTWTVYDFHHYHSTAHEALAVARGNAVLMLGGEGGREVAVGAGDLIVLPAGTGHRRLRASGDFAVCGAYPPGQKADLLRPEEADPEESRQRIAAVPLPRTDPFYGANGPLLRLWGQP
ncbi:MAG TPA: cupin domain-containing protein [Paracoccaceae bacterium]|nr:cupin domain-containing protein [Paracoccaceae bacterium]